MSITEKKDGMKPNDLTLQQKLAIIQATLRAPKSNFNSFGKYAYRSCEDILEALKPYIRELEVVVTLHDEIVQVGERYYVKATASITDGTSVMNVAAQAREENDKKGMDSAQLTGSTSSYARKYALAGLFLLDDVKDSDSTNTHGKDQSYSKMNDQTQNAGPLKPSPTVPHGTNEPLASEAQLGALKRMSIAHDPKTLTKKQASEMIAAANRR